MVVVQSTMHCFVHVTSTHLNLCSFCYNSDIKSPWNLMSLAVKQIWQSTLLLIGRFDFPWPMTLLKGARRFFSPMSVARWDRGMGISRIIMLKNSLHPQPWPFLHPLSSPVTFLSLCHTHINCKMPPFQWIMETLHVYSKVSSSKEGEKKQGTSQCHICRLYFKCHHHFFKIILKQLFCAVTVDKELFQPDLTCKNTFQWCNQM